MHKFKVGDRVRFTGMGPLCHATMPWYYPEDGTIGTVSIASADDIEVYVQWPRGSTSEEDMWWAFVECLERVEE